MKKLLHYIQGDKVIWALTALLALFSFLPVYSASSNLVYVLGSGTPAGHLFKHAVLLFLGFVIIYAVHKIPYNYYKGLAVIALPVVIVLLIYTLTRGTTIGGVNASRWIQLPLLGVSFQTSTLASVVLLVYTARYLARIKEHHITLKESILPLWLPVFITVMLILPANFSTAAMLFVTILILCFLGGYPFKFLGVVVGLSVLGLAIFMLSVKAFPEYFPNNRLSTWTARFENFMDGQTTEADYQIEKAKIAIATGGTFGLGAGKSVMKNFLPQSSSDFIFAIIVEEYGLLGALGLLFVYLFLLFRLVIVVLKADTLFGKLLAAGIGIPIIFQALVNMAVAVDLFPVTGQTLPLISSGGTSIWVTCLSIGIILGVSRKRQQLAEAQERIQVEAEVKEEHPLEILSEQL